MGEQSTLPTPDMNTTEFRMPITYLEDEPLTGTTINPGEANYNLDRARLFGGDAVASVVDYDGKPVHTITDAKPPTPQAAPAPTTRIEYV